MPLNLLLTPPEIPLTGPLSALYLGGRWQEPPADAWGCGDFRENRLYVCFAPRFPGEWSTGEGHRRITKTGNTRMRSLLIQAALSIMRLRDPRTAGLRAWALRIAARQDRIFSGGLCRYSPSRGERTV
jgi:transposase